MKRKIVIVIGIISILFIIIVIFITYQQKQSVTTPLIPTTTPTSSFVPSPQIQNDRSDFNEEYNRELEIYRQTEPDFYLAQFTPIITPDYTIIRRYTTSPKPHQAFVIVLDSKDSVKSRQMAREYILSKGLTEQQIEELDITYTFE